MKDFLQCGSDVIYCILSFFKMKTFAQSKKRACEIAVICLASVIHDHTFFNKTISLPQFVPISTVTPLSLNSSAL